MGEYRASRTETTESGPSRCEGESVEVSSNDKDGNSIQAYESGEAETGALR